MGPSYFSKWRSSLIFPAISSIRKNAQTMNATLSTWRYGQPYPVGVVAPECPYHTRRLEWNFESEHGHCGKLVEIRQSLSLVVLWLDILSRVVHKCLWKHCNNQTWRRQPKESIIVVTLANNQELQHGMHRLIDAEDVRNGIQAPTILLLEGFRHCFL